MARPARRAFSRSGRRAPYVALWVFLQEVLDGLSGLREKACQSLSPLRWRLSWPGGDSQPGQGMVQFQIGPHHLRKGGLIGPLSERWRRLQPGSANPLLQEHRERRYLGAGTRRNQAARMSRRRPTCSCNPLPGSCSSLGAGRREGRGHRFPSFRFLHLLQARQPSLYPVPGEGLAFPRRFTGGGGRSLAG